MAFWRGKLNFCILPVPPPRNLALKFVSSFKEISSPQVARCLLSVSKYFVSSGMCTSERRMRKNEFVEQPAMVNNCPPSRSCRIPPSMCAPPGRVMGAVGHWGLCGRCRCSGAYEWGESLVETSENSSDFSLVVPWCAARLFCRGWIFCWWSLCMSVESKQWRRLHNSHFFLWLTAWPPQQYDLIIMQAAPEGRARHTLMFALSLSISQWHMESLGPSVGVTHWWNGLGSTVTSKPATPG